MHCMLPFGFFAPPSGAGFWFQANRRPRSRGKLQFSGLLAALTVEECEIASGVLGRGHELHENPFLQQPSGTLRKSQKFHAGLSHGVNPRYSSRGFDAHSRVCELEAQKDLLMYEERSSRLNRNARVAQIANDAAVSLVQIDVSQALNLVAIVTPPAERCKTTCIRHVRHAKIHGEILAKGAEASQYRRWFNDGWLKQRGSTNIVLGPQEAGLSS